MKYSQFDEVNDIIEQLLNGHKHIFGNRVVAYYLYGSLVWGDFDITSSDIDTLCVIDSEVTLEEMESLRRMHEQITNDRPKWNNRVEVHYAPLDGLKRFRQTSFRMGNISPGEPLHMIDAGVDWIDEWYCVQEYAITLYGMSKEEVIPHIEKWEFIQTICSYARSFRERIKSSKQSCYSQAYAVLTLCRALYSRKKEEQISKPGAARWAMDFLPEYTDLIQNALIWREERDSTCRNPLETYVPVEKFVNDILNRYFDLESTS